MLKQISLAASFLVTVATVLVVAGIFNRGNGAGELPTNIENIVWKTNDLVQGDTEKITFLWNEFLIDAHLYAALQNSSDKYIAVAMTKADGQGIEQSKYSEIIGKAEHNAYKKDTVYLFVTKDEFLNLKIENKAEYLFCLASRDAYESYE